MSLLCWRCGAKRRILGLGHEAPPGEVARARRGRRVLGPLPDGAQGEGAVVGGAREPPPRGPLTPDGGCGAQKALQQSPAAGLHRGAEVLRAFRRDRPLRRLRLRALSAHHLPHQGGRQPCKEVLLLQVPHDVQQQRQGLRLRHQLPGPAVGGDRLASRFLHHLQPGAAHAPVGGVHRA